MNYIITHSCNKGCSYCFAREQRDKMNAGNMEDMSIDTFRKFLDKETDQNVKLLGGEPTSHPQFKEFLDIVLKETNKNVTIISNFLFKESVLETIVEYIQEFIKDKRQIYFLVNCTELDVKNRMNVFKYNYTMLYSLLYKYDLEGNLSCGITLETNKDAKFYIDYINFLYENMGMIEDFRLSIAFPGTNDDKKTNMYINDTDTGKKLISIVKHLNNINVPSHIDCIIFPCMFENKEEYKYIKKFMSQVRFRCGRNAGAPADIFADGSIIYCYPLKDTIKTNLNIHKNGVAARDNIGLKYQIIEGNMILPEACQKCVHYENNVCAGPCLGLYSKEELDKLELDFE